MGVSTGWLETLGVTAMAKKQVKNLKTLMQEARTFAEMLAILRETKSKFFQLAALRQLRLNVGCHRS